MTKELQDAIKKLRTVAPKLNKATDEVNEVFAMVEKFLCEEVSVGIEAEVHVYPSDGDPQSETGATFTLLNFGRLDGKFRMFVHRSQYWERQDSYGYIQSEEKTIEKSAWSSCPRGLRLDAFQVLPELIETIAKKAVESVEKATGTARTVKSVLGALSEK